MLIATAAMGFVALGAAGVGTAAWYQVTNTSSQVKDTASISTRNNAITAGALKFSIEFVESGDYAPKSNLDLIDSSGQSKYAIAGATGKYVAVPSASTNTHGFLKYTVTITKDGDAGGTISELFEGFFAAQANNKVVLTVAVKEGTAGKGLQVLESADGTTAPTTFSDSISYTVDLTASSFTNYVYTGYVAYYVRADEDDDNETSVGGVIGAELNGIAVYSGA